jgi:hypothetical protein
MSFNVRPRVLSLGYENGDGGVEKEEVYFKAVYWNILSSVLEKVNLRVSQARKAAAGKTESDDAMDQGLFFETYGNRGG